MGANTGLHLDYLSLAECEAARWTGVLGAAVFSGRAPASRGGENGLGVASVRDLPVPLATVSTPVLVGSPDLCEIWRAPEAADSGQRGRVHFRRAGQLLFGCISLSEADLAADHRGNESAALPRAASASDLGALGADAAPTGPAMNPANGEYTALHQATQQAYREILTVLDAFDCPHLVRVWNYLPEINQITHGVERYRQFNSARQEALLVSGRAVTGRVPAACALGAEPGSPLVIYFLASREAPLFLENPRQVSAYNYPPQYGARAPVFSRATVLREPGGPTLFISGTASIVGHETVHAGDAAAQTRETLTNIDALLGEAKRVTGGGTFSLETLACKVYVRRPEDLPVIRAEVSSALGPNARAIYLKADICRQDLFVEIEAVGT